MVRSLVRELVGPNGWLHVGGLVVRSAALLGVAIRAAETSIGGSGGGERPDPSTGVVSSGPMPGGPTGPDGPNLRTPQPAVDLRRHPWSSVQPTGQPAEVLVHTTLSGGPPCAVLGRVEVVETADAVTITLWVGRQPEADCSGPQPELGYPLATPVRLSAPVGRRQLRDGAAQEASGS